MPRTMRVAPDVRLEEQRTLTSRATRSPQHTFMVRLRPWQIVPCVIAPVLPGESLKNGLLQARVISDPIKNPLSGWWLEFFLFYVRVRDLEVADTVRNAVVDPANNMSAINQAATTAYFHANANCPSWARECMRSVVRAYFRQEGEDWDSRTLDGYPTAAISGSGWYDSAIPASSLPAETGADDWERSWSIYQGMRRAKLTTNTYAEWLAKYGVKVPPQMTEAVQDYRIPELVRFVRDFAYPVPTVEPTTGLIAATVQWTMAERIDKRRFFDEPGFLFGVMVTRPKVYLQNQRTAVADLLLNSHLGWLPPEFETDPHTGLLKVTAAAPNGPVHGSTVDYWMDRRDLYLHGDQFLNFDLAAPPGTAGDWNLVALPATNVANVRYCSLTDAQGVFVGGGTPAREYVKSDGILSLKIASRIGMDTTA